MNSFYGEIVIAIGGLLVVLAFLLTEIVDIFFEDD